MRIPRVKYVNTRPDLTVAKSLITKKEAFAAIEQLYAEGKHPTHLSLREKLGRRGSGPTLSRYLDEWAKDRGPALANAVANYVLAAPELEARRNLEEEIRRVVAGEEAKSRAALEKVEQELRERADYLTSREEALLLAEGNLNDREAQLAQLISELTADKRELGLQLQSANAAAAAAAEDARSQIQRLVDDRLVAQQQRDVATSRLEELQRQAAADRADISRLSARLLELEQQLTAVRRERDDALEDRRRSAADLTAQLGTALAAADALRMELGQAQQSLHAMGAELASTRAHAADATAERDRLAALADRSGADQLRALELAVARLAQQHREQESGRATLETAFREFHERSASVLKKLEAAAAAIESRATPPVG